jgi:DNA-binding HxlR family transcriptional regulator
MGILYAEFKKEGDTQMNNNPLIVEHLAQQRLADLRSEGMRSQRIAREVPDQHKSSQLPEEGRLLTGLLARMIGMAYGWLRQTGANHPLAR